MTPDNVKQPTVKNPLINIHPVLVRPRIAANIGAAVRAAKAMGLGAVRLVQPHADVNDDQAISLAAGARGDLDKVVSVKNVAAAVRGAVRVIGFSARQRDHRSPPIWLEEAARDAVAAAQRGPVMLLFGTERTGLENEELDHAQIIARIPTSPEFHSINLAQSVMITGYELRRQAGGVMESYNYTPATAEMVERCVLALVEALDRRAFFISSKRVLAIRKLHDIAGRTLPLKNEVLMLRGMIRSLDTDKIVESKSSGKPAVREDRVKRRARRKGKNKEHDGKA